jgi:hypothetical protein
VGTLAIFIAKSRIESFSERFRNPFSNTNKKGKNKIYMFTIKSALLYAKIIYVPTVPYFARSSGWIRIPVALGVTPSIKNILGVHL